MTGRAAQPAGFGADSRGCFEQLMAWLEGGQATGMTHAELEDELASRGRDLLRRMLQDHLTLRAATEPRLAAVADDAGVVHAAVETGHTRALASVFGQVKVERLAYRHRGHAEPAPGRRGAEPAGREALPRAAPAGRDRSRPGLVRAGRRGDRPGHRPAGRQTPGRGTHRPRRGRRRRLLRHRRTHRAGPGRRAGPVRRRQGHRDAPRRAAPGHRQGRREGDARKLATRLSKGEKRNRKRMAEVGAVYDLAPVPRQATDVLAGKTRRAPAASGTEGQRTSGSPPASPTTPPQVVASIFDEAERRDPDHRRTWVALVDGNNHQIDRIQAEASARGIAVPIVIDLIHVLEYLWDAAWCFFTEGDPAAETWVRQRALAILQGHAVQVAAGIRRRASAAKLARPKRAKADECANYLINKAAYLDYPTALAAGWPIATGIIEGACRHLVEDRMDITGARWSLTGAEAVLKLRALQQPTATSTPTGDSTSTENNDESTDLATPTTSSRSPRSHSNRAAPEGFPRRYELELLTATEPIQR